MMFRWLAWGAAAVCSFTSSDADASDPRLRRVDPLLRTPSGATALDEVTAIVRIGGETDRIALEAEGIRFRHGHDGRPIHVGPLFLVEAQRGALARVAERGMSVRVSRPIAMEPTLYATGNETQAMDLWGYGPTPTQGVLGRRITLGTFEPGLNIFHPHFFRADGGAWPWVDVDADGVFTPGIDGVDTNLDGQVAENERLALLDYGFNVGDSVMGYGGTFQTGYDYLYVDSDGSGAREFGPAAGYSEASPGFGEAMFMPDDANGDGELGIEERVVLLGTSQVAGFWAFDGVYTRGEDLINVPPIDTYSDEASHGTSTMGIMTGGQTHPFRATRGLVPDADIAVVAYHEGSDHATEGELLEEMSWLIEDMGVAVVNHSWALSGNRVHLDGSNVVDAAIDAAYDEGVVQVCSAGNYRDDDKHDAVTTSEGVASFTVSVPSSMSGWVLPTIQFDLHWPADRGSFTCTVERPNGATHVVQEIPDGQFENLTVDAFRADSDRGWALLSMSIANPSGGSVGGGTWRFDCVHDGEREFLVHARIADGTQSSDAAVFDTPTMSSTMASPAIADHCIAVAGYAIQFTQYDTEFGDLEPYSAMGPRFDGAMAIDIAGPVDAVAPANDPEHVNAFTAFNGTSGSAPQVSAIVALMRMLDPELTPAEIVERIQQSGEVDEYVGDVELPDPEWGYGKLRGYEAFLGEEPPPRPRQQAIDLVVEYAYADGECAATMSADGVDWDDASFRWDDEYDGTWDTEFEAADSRTLMFAEAGQAFHVRVDAAERGYIVAGAVLVGEVPDSCFEPPPDESTGTGESAEGSSTAASDSSAGDETDDMVGSQTGGSDGCGCRPGTPPASSIFALGVLVLLGRRSRRTRESVARIDVAINGRRG